MAAKTPPPLPPIVVEYVRPGQKLSEAAIEQERRKREERELQAEKEKRSRRD